jgi:hypothetical protein
MTALRAEERDTMATFIISGSLGTDDSTMTTLPFMAAKIAKGQGHEVVPGSGMKL